MSRTCTFAALFFTLAGCAAGRPAPPPARPGEPVLTVVSYNVNIGLAGDPQTLAAIFESNADILFLQEVTPA